MTSQYAKSLTMGVAALLVLCAMAASAATVPSWSTGLYPVMGFNGPVYATAVFDDGSGPALYAAGNFQAACGARASNIAKWNGYVWQPLGIGTDGPIHALTVYDDVVTGTSLYAAGSFTTAGGAAAANIARWKAGAWSAVGGGLPGPVNTLTVYQPQSSYHPVLYAGGAFGATSNISYWSAGEWRDFGVTGEVTAMAPYLDRLYIAAWDGSSHLYTYSSTNFLEVTIPYTGLVYDMISFSNRLYICGTISGPGIRGVAELGGYLAPLGGTGGGIAGTVRSLAIHDDGSGPALYAAGDFRMAGSTAASSLAKWNGTNWSAVGGGVKGAVNRLASYDDGVGPSLYAFGSFTKAGGVDTGNAARYKDGVWSPLADGLTGPIYAYGARYETQNYAGGVGGIYSVGLQSGSCTRFARVESARGLPFVSALAGYGFGGKFYLIAGGRFDSVDGVPARNIAKWDGTSWSALGEGTDDDVYALAASGSNLFAAGAFTTAGGMAASHIAKWDGSTWNAMGDGFDWDVYALCSSGSLLYAGGAFLHSGATPINHVAAWNGTAWSPLYGGLPSEVRCIFNNTASIPPSGLYVGGSSRTESGAPANPLVRYANSTWTPVPGLDVPCRVDAMAYYGFTQTPELAIAGSFFSAGGDPLRCIGRFGSSGLTALGTGIDDCAGITALYPPARSSYSWAILAGGEFNLVNGGASSGMAVWTGPETVYTRTVSSAKGFSDRTVVKMADTVCTATFGETFYVEQPDRASGMQVVMPGHGLVPGVLVTPTGRMRTSAHGERYLEAWSAVPGAEASVDPLLLNNATLGGGKFGLQAATSGWRWVGNSRVLGEAAGLNNIGLLVRTCGKVVEAEGNWFTIDDGSDATIRCILPLLSALPAPGDVVTVTGICSCEKKPDGIHPILRVRSATDVTPF